MTETCSSSTFLCENTVIFICIPVDLSLIDHFSIGSYSCDLNSWMCNYKTSIETKFMFLNKSGKLVDM